MPVKHPDPFSYTTEGLTNGVNPYVAVLSDACSSGDLPLAFGAALATFPGAWRERVAAYHGRSTPYQQTVVEIGCHLGHTLLTMAEAFPDTLFIGIDITFKRVVTTAQRARKRGLKNVYCILANAAALPQLFQAGEIDGCVIFFPDPWCKKARQAKHRLVDLGFCQELGKVLAADGFCWLKTDHHPYFEDASDFLTEAGFTPVKDPTGLLAATFTSTFERRFQLQHLPTFAGKWLKPGAPGRAPQAAKDAASWTPTAMV